MGINISILILIGFIIGWSGKQFKEIKSRDKELNTRDLLEYIRGIEIRIIILFVGIFIMFMGLR